MAASTNANEEEPKSSIYPELHSYIATNLEEGGLKYTFRQNDQKVGIKQVYDTKRRVGSRLGGPIPHNTWGALCF
ncbi:hypothetical protein FOXYSP1_03475 [Fusarium oxysporum f. sp. phaseoli]